MSENNKTKIVHLRGGTVRRGGSFTLWELACANCGAIPQDGDLRHLFWLESAQEAILTCEECYQELREAFSR